MRKLALLTVLVLMVASVGGVQAEIIPPRGFGQIGLQAVAPCVQLSLRSGPGASSDKVRTLSCGDQPIVMEQSNGWPASPSGIPRIRRWAGSTRATSPSIPPGFGRRARCRSTPGTTHWAPKVALLDENTTLPILTDEGAWLIVSLHGAVGWIQQ